MGHEDRAQADPLPRVFHDGSELRCRWSFRGLQTSDTDHHGDLTLQLMRMLPSEPETHFANVDYRRRLALVGVTEAPRLARYPSMAGDRLNDDLEDRARESKMGRLTSRGAPSNLSPEGTSSSAHDRVAGLDGDHRPRRGASSRKAAPAEAPYSASRSRRVGCCSTHSSSFMPPCPSWKPSCRAGETSASENVSRRAGDQETSRALATAHRPKRDDPM